MRDYVKKIIFYSYLAITVGLILLLLIIVNAGQPRYLHFYAFAVGQGDSLCIRTPQGHTIVIDGGPNGDVVAKLGAVMPFYDRTIDLLILTHPHADHVTGLVEVLKRYQVKRILTTGLAYDSPMYHEWLLALQSYQSRVEIADHVGILPVEKNLNLYILFPDHSLSNQKINNANNGSIVAKLIFQRVSILLPGDYEQEETLIKKNYDLRSTILKVGHHGSDNGSSFAFLQAVLPRIAIITVGKNNRYHLPKAAVITMLQKVGAKILRTDLNGDIDVVSDGSHVWLQ